MVYIVFPDALQFKASLLCKHSHYGRGVVSAVLMHHMCTPAAVKDEAVSNIYFYNPQDIVIGFWRRTLLGCSVNNHRRNITATAPEQPCITLKQLVT